MTFAPPYRPVVECTCRALKDVLEVTDVPGMKQMVQKYIIMGFKRLLVDPGKQHIDFTPAPLPGKSVCVCMPMTVYNIKKY